MIIDGFILAYGIIKLQLEQEYANVPKGVIALIGSLIPAIYHLMGPFAMSLIQKYPYRPVVIAGGLLQVVGFLLPFANYWLQWGFAVELIGLGVLQGFGSGLLFGPSLVIIEDYFGKDMRLPSAIVTCGTPTGALFFGFFFKYLMMATPWAWRGACLFFALFSALIVVPCSFIMINPPKPVHSEAKAESIGNKSDNIELAEAQVPLRPEGEAKIAAKETAYFDHVKALFSPMLFKTRIFWAIFFSTAFSVMGYYIPTLLITGQSKHPQYNVSPWVQNNLVTSWGLAHLVGRFTSGRLSHWDYKSKLLSSFSLYTIGLFVSALSLIIFPFVMSYGDVAFIAFVLLYGFFSAPFIALQSAFVNDIYYNDQQRYRSALGWVISSDVPFIITGWVVSTSINELNPLYAYLFGAASFIVAAGLVISTRKQYFDLYKTRIEQRHQ